MGYSHHTQAWNREQWGRKKLFIKMLPIWGRWWLSGPQSVSPAKHRTQPHPEPESRAPSPFLSVLWGPRLLCEQVSSFRLSFPSVRTCGALSPPTRRSFFPVPREREPTARLPQLFMQGLRSWGPPEPEAALAPPGPANTAVLASTRWSRKESQVLSWAIIAVWSCSIPQATAGGVRPRVALALGTSRLPTRRGGAKGKKVRQPRECSSSLTGRCRGRERRVETLSTLYLTPQPQFVAESSKFAASPG